MLRNFRAYRKERKRITQKERKMGFFERNFGGSVRIGPAIFYGFNAMHCAVNIKSRWGWICLKPPTHVFGRWWGWYFYISHDGTPCQDAGGNLRFGIGPGMRD